VGSRWMREGGVRVRVVGSTARSAEVCAWPASKATELALHGKGSHAASSPGAFVRDLVQYAPCA